MKKGPKVRPFLNLPPRGSVAWIELIVRQAAQKLLLHLYENLPSSPDNITSHEARNDAIRDKYARGSSLIEVSRIFDLSPQRIHQIVTDDA